jgi:hypothetical protein
VPESCAAAQPGPLSSHLRSLNQLPIKRREKPFFLSLFQRWKPQASKSMKDILVNSEKELGEKFSFLNFDT